MTETRTPTDPLIISFVSGKGGVGKTMLAVACARELSLTNCTLIIDLDFFNRGLTGLLDEGMQRCGEIDKPDFLSDAQQAETGKWKIVRASRNLFHISYPDLSPDDMQKFETLNVDTLKESLRRFVKGAAAKCECNCIVIDCHGGPDNSSFAACLISDYSLLVSEPDRITFYGTLNFLRQLKRMSPTQDLDLRLVFNKVVPAFSGLFLKGFYDRLLRGEFGGRLLLAIFPLEVYLTKEFEKTPFLTAVYPYSWLTKKTRLMLYDLLCHSHRTVLAPVIRSMPRWMRAYRRLSLGRPFPLLNVSVIMPTIVSVLVGLALFTLAFNAFFIRERENLVEGIHRVRALQCLRKSPILAADPEKVRTLLDRRYPDDADRSSDIDSFRACMSSDQPDYWEYHGLLRVYAQVMQDRNRDSVPDQYRAIFDNEVKSLTNQRRLFLTFERVSETIEPYFGFLAYLGALWLVLALLSTWTSELDKRFTYYFRLRKYPTMLFFAFTAIALWFAPLLIVGSVAGTLIQRGPHVGDLEKQAIVLIGLGAVTFIVTLLGQMYRVYRDARYEHHYLEDLCRVLFLVYLIAMPFVLYRAFVRR